MPDYGSVSWRWWHLYLPYLVLAVGMGVALFLVSTRASSGELSAERTDRLTQDCASRVEARDVLRDVITQAYAPPSLQLPPDVVARYVERRDALLDRVPTLRCETKQGIPIPEPIGTNADPPGTTSTVG